ncbi:uncharacterized protein B0T23DRAFT_408378 [Neurospora hispaniola]|uniref:Uncharacterized protein n=1 Tax=Neurospora hispaniola TaxID=588809 RepID=A0AAJ0HYK9_9PEZI|nr:hypothetical protein B0T23DRAFT_408378 [Neurospora hispaniola]
MRLAAVRSEVGLSGKNDKAVNRAQGITKFSGMVPDQSVNTDFSLTRGMGCLDAASAAPSWMRETIGARPPSCAFVISWSGVD